MASPNSITVPKVRPITIGVGQLKNCKFNEKFCYNCADIEFFLRGCFYWCILYTLSLLTSPQPGNTWAPCRPICSPLRWSWSKTENNDVWYPEWNPFLPRAYEETEPTASNHRKIAANLQPPVSPQIYRVGKN